MSTEVKPQYRFYRPRRPGGKYGEGLALEGVTSKFGLIGIGILLLVGLLILLGSGTPKEKDLAPIEIEITAPPYRTPSLRNSVLLPVTRARVLAIHPATFKAADSAKLFSLKKRDVLTVWLTAAEAQKWNAGVARKDFYTALVLQKKNSEWVVDYESFRKKAGKSSSHGWWIILFSLILIPYQLISRPKIPVWAAIGGFILVLVIWNFVL